MITLSILIPSYNHAHFIVDTLNSHVENNPFSYEIVIIDDGSSDNSVEIIQNWINKHPEVRTRFISRENRGVTSTLNQLIDLAEGKYIRMFGSDDLSFPGANQKLVDYLELTGDQAVFGFARVIDKKSKIISSNSIEFLKRKPSDYEKEMKRSIILRWAIVGPSLVLKRDSFEKIGKFNEKSLIEDWYLYLNLISAFKVSFLNTPVADYRIHDSNASRTKDKNKRIKNIESQLMSGEESLKKFSGKEFYMLKAEVSFLKSKLYFLRGEFIKCLKSLISFSFFYLRSYL